MSANRNQAGFTIPELTISMVVTGILVIGLFAGIATYFKLISQNNAGIDLTVSSQNLLRSTVEALRYGGGVEQSNTITDPNAPVGGWNTSNSNFVIVIDTPAEDSAHNYIINPATGGPYMNELVYYKNGGSLMRRALANPGALGNSLQTSCPSNLASSSCPADKDLADYVNSMVFTLYDRNANQITDPTKAHSVKIDLTMNRTIFGTSLSQSNSIRVTLRNDFSI